MRSRIHSLTMAMLAIITVTLAAVCGTGTATAQICNNTGLTIINNSTCTVGPCLTRVGLTPLCFPAIAPGITVVAAIPAGTNFNGVQSAGGTAYAWVPTTPPATMPLVATCFRGAPSNCCIDIYYDPATCTIRIVNSGCFIPCRP